MALSNDTVLVTEDDVKLALGNTTGIKEDWITFAVAATIAYVVDLKGQLLTWPWDYKLGATKIAAGLVRDAASPAIAEPFSSGSVARRATDVEIEQLLKTGRFQRPAVG